MDGNRRSVADEEEEGVVLFMSACRCCVSQSVCHMSVCYQGGVRG